MKKSNKKINGLKSDFRKTKLGKVFFIIFVMGAIIFAISFLGTVLITLLDQEAEDIYFLYVLLSVVGCSAIGIGTGLYVGALKEYLEENK